jgi:outer membrane protein assembly factor BamB
VALRARDGRVLWRFNAGIAGVGPPVLDGGRVYLERENAGMLALSAATGELLWEEEPNAIHDALEPVAAAGVVYTVDALGLRARRGADGTLLWMTETTLTGTPALAGGAVFLAGSCSAQAFDRADGRVLWDDTPVRCGGISPWGPALHADRVYGGVAPDADGAVHDARTGARLRPMTVGAFPAFAGKIGLFPDAHIRGERVLFGNTIVARGLPRGQARWRFRGDGFIDMPPLIVNDAVYLASASGRIYALDLRSGAVRWRARVARPPLGHRGAGLAAGDGLVVVPALGRLYAFRSA